jgi:hypothetical protein
MFPSTHLQLLTDGMHGVVSRGHSIAEPIAVIATIGDQRGGFGEAGQQVLGALGVTHLPAVRCSTMGLPASSQTACSLEFNPGQASARSKPVPNWRTREARGRR